MPSPSDTAVTDPTGPAPDLAEALLTRGAQALVDDLVEAELAVAGTRTAMLASVEFTPMPELGEELPVDLRPELALARELARESLAEATRRGYTSGWKQFATWCVEHGASPLPAQPGIVAAYLAVLAVAVDERGDVLRDEEGRPLRGKVPGTVALRLQAINKAHEARGLPIPGKDPQVAAVLAGIRRTYGVRPEHQRVAIDLDRLRALLDAVDAPQVAALTANAIRLLGGRLGWTAGQMARLRWPDIRFGDDRVTLDAPATTARGQATVITVRRHRNPRLCLVTALAELHSRRRHNQEVIADPSGRPYTRQGLHKALLRLAAEVPGWRPGAGPVPDRQLLSCLPEPEQRTTKQLRDRALLLTGWSCALRRSNLTMLTWRDLTPEAGEWGLLVRRSKTDQTGANPHRHWLPLAGDDMPCPATALTAWHQEVTRLLGHDPRVHRPDQPVFCPIDRHGNVRVAAGGKLTSLSGEAINELVQDLAYAAGLAVRPTRIRGQRVYHQWGAHGLRAGFITEGLRDGKLTIEEVQQISGHKCLEVLLGYRREVNARANNPARKLFKPRPS
ncbi:tyrosine-type recombinase/integrase [Blastococcus mobilis]|uniref:Phage integrase family protein n=1 Tax=Blastococcus mobilis TaxID=1938746 RepID=A0A238ZRC6_9ACTN|nr:tyrosine-type recombinase/integrase [Blastococcus mobilis]SNR85957.1 Phage integrase family protein [Blastococcus mobilis]